MINKIFLFLSFYLLVSDLKSQDCQEMTVNLTDSFNVCVGTLLELAPELNNVQTVNWLHEETVLSDLDTLLFAPELGTTNVTLAYSNEICSDTMQVTITATLLQSPEVLTGELEFCATESTELSAISDNQIIWMRNGLVYSMYPSITVNESGTYSALQIDGSCVSGSNNIEVDAYALPVAEINDNELLNQAEFCENPGINLASTGIGMGNWYLNGDSIGVGSSIQVNESGVYSLIVTSDFCPSHETSIELNAIESPITPSLILAGNNLVSDLQMGMTYNWYYNDEMIHEDYATSLELNGDGTYYVEVVNELGCAVSSEPFISLNTNEMSAAELLLFPNPCTEFLWIDSGLNAVEQIILTDLSGKTVLDNSSIHEKIDLSSLPTGFYVAQVWLESGEMIQKRVIKH